MTGRRFIILILTLLLARGVMLATGFRFVHIPGIDPGLQWIGAQITMLGMGLRAKMHAFGTP